METTKSTPTVQSFEGCLYDISNCNLSVYKQLYSLCSLTCCSPILYTPAAPSAEVWWVLAPPPPVVHRSFLPESQSLIQ